MNAAVLRGGLIILRPVNYAGDADQDVAICTFVSPRAILKTKTESCAANGGVTSHYAGTGG